MPITSKDFSCHKKIIKENYLNLTIDYCLMTQKIRNGLTEKLILPLTITTLTFGNPEYFCNPQDKRYIKKLNLLKEYNFITNTEYDNLSKNLGSLNYLLKE